MGWCYFLIIVSKTSWHSFQYSFFILWVSLMANVWEVLWSCDIILCDICLYLNVFCSLKYLIRPFSITKLMLQCCNFCLFYKKDVSVFSIIYRLSLSRIYFTNFFYFILLHLILIQLKKIHFCFLKEVC